MSTQPSETHHHIVFLQGDFVQIPELELPSPQTYTQAIYSQTSLSEVHERIHNASILVISALKIDAAALSAEVAPHLKLIVIVAAGSDCVDLQACKKRGIAVSNSPGQNFETVSEHAIGLYFTTRRKMIDMHMLTRAGEWPRERTLMFHMLDKDGIPPLTCQEEVVGIIGNGSVGMDLCAMHHEKIERNIDSSQVKE